MKRILFISHNATLTGAPMVLLNLIKWISNNNHAKFVILINEPGYDNGILMPEFAKVGTTYIASTLTDHELYHLITREKIDLIYSNTIVNISLLEKILSVINVPHICHVHELENVISECAGLKQNIKWLNENTQKFIACSQAVADNLVLNNAIPSSKIKVIQEFIQLPSIHEEVLLEEKKSLRKKLNISEDTFILGAVGAMQFRKGFDLIIPIGISLKLRKIPFKILLVGVSRNTDSIMFDRICDDIKKSNLEKNILLIEPDLNIEKYYALFDTFLMLSREDPFPLVNLHAASFRCPILCFKNSGGSAEFVGEDAGFLIEYLDTETIADKITLLANDQVLRAKMGSAAKKKVELKNSVEALCPSVLSCIEDTLKENPRIDTLSLSIPFLSNIQTHTYFIPDYDFIISNEPKEAFKDRYESIKEWYHDQYEILPAWYKRFGHIIKIITGKKKIRNYLN